MYAKAIYNATFESKVQSHLKRIAFEFKKFGYRTPSSNENIQIYSWKCIAEHS